MKGKDIGIEICSYGKIFAAGILCFWLLMIVAAGISSPRIVEHANAAIEELTHEYDLNPVYFFGTDSAAADDFTDRTMYRMVLRAGETNGVVAGSLLPGYTRYWHGYLAYLRPLSALFSYEQIRYIHMFLFNFLLMLVLVKMKERLGWKAAGALLLALTAVFMILAPVSLQFYPCFMLTFLGVLAVLYLVKHKKRWLGKCFWLLGMLTNFFDFLTFPLMTLGIPLIIVLVLSVREELGRQKGWSTMLKLSLLWGTGYGLTWIAKWVLAALVLKADIVGEVSGKIAERTLGTGETQIQRLEMYKLNIKSLFLLEGSREIGMFLLVLAAAGVILFFLFRKKNPRKLSDYGPVFAVCLFPYIWYGILAEHSLMHYWFTYRAQAVTIFGVLLVYSEFLEKRSLRKRVQREKNESNDSR